MNENEFGKKLKPWLDRSAAGLGEMQATKLKSARLRALDKWREPVRLMGLVTVPAGTAETLHYGVFQRALLWLPVVALIAARRLHRPGFPRVARQVARLIAAAVLAVSCTAVAQAPRDAAKLKTPQTPWSSLSPQDRRVLGPIAPEWDRMPGYQQERLRSSARRYPDMQPIQKERFEQRIRDWAAMSPEQRRAARETFQGLRKLPPEKQHELRQRWLERRSQEPDAPQRPR
jgi:hypothetical protein